MPAANVPKTYSDRELHRLRKDVEGDATAIVRLLDTMNHELRLIREALAGGGFAEKTPQMTKSITSDEGSDDEGAVPERDALQP